MINDFVFSKYMLKSSCTMCFLIAIKIFMCALFFFVLECSYAYIFKFKSLAYLIFTVYINYCYHKYTVMVEFQMLKFVLINARESNRKSPTMFAGKN